MSVYTRTVSTGQVTDDASFRVFGKWFSDSWQALGWTKVSDAGQIDWTSTTRGASGAVSGYEVRQSTDALTAIYFKIEYVAGHSSGTSNPEFYLTFGTGQNGSGTLTGTVSTRQRWGMYAAGSLVTTFVLSGGTSRWSIAMIDTASAAGSGAYSCATICQRTCDDADGADNSSGFIYAGATCHAALTTPTWFSGCIDFSTGQCGEDTGPTWMWMQGVPRFSADKPVFFTLYVRGATSHVMLRDMILTTTGLGYPRSVSHLTHYGSQKTFMSATQSSAATQNGYIAPVAMSLHVRAE